MYSNFLTLKSTGLQNYMWFSQVICIFKDEIVHVWQFTMFANKAKLQNTLPLICILLNKTSIYCYIPHSSKHADTCNGWAGVFYNNLLC